MKRLPVCLLLVFTAALCFARGKQEIIVSENFSSETSNVVVTIVNKSEADFQTLVLTRKEDLSDKWGLTSRRTFTIRSGESKSVVLDNQGLYKVELYDAKGHKFSKKNTSSQIITDNRGNVISEGEFQLFTQPWQKLVFTEQDFEPQAAIDIAEVFFGVYGNEKHDEPPVKTCSVLVVNNTGEPIEYLSVVQDGNARSSNLAIGRGQCGVLDIKQSSTADISLISRGRRVFTKTALSFDSENLTVIFTQGDKEEDGDKASQFVNSTLGSITNALSITTQMFSSVFGKADEDAEFETIDDASDEADGTDGSETAAPGAEADGAQASEEPAEQKSFWSRHFSWLPWVD